MKICIVILLEYFEGRFNYSWFGCFNKYEENKYQLKVFEVLNFLKVKIKKQRMQDNFEMMFYEVKINFMYIIVLYFDFYVLYIQGFIKIIGVYEKEFKKY